MQFQKLRNTLGARYIVLVFGSLLSSRILAGAGALSKELIQPSKEMQVCDRNDDCVELEISCSHCCKVGAINKKFLDKYSQQKSLRCKNYHGRVCNCVAVPVSVECFKSSCRIKSQAGLER